MMSSFLTWNRHGIYQINEPWLDGVPGVTQVWHSRVEVHCEQGPNCS